MHASGCSSNTRVTRPPGMWSGPRSHAAWSRYGLASSPTAGRVWIPGPGWERGARRNPQQRPRAPGRSPAFLWCHPSLFFPLPRCETWPPPSSVSKAASVSPFCVEQGCLFFIIQFKLKAEFTHSLLTSPWQVLICSVLSMSLVSSVYL